MAKMGGALFALALGVVLTGCGDDTSSSSSEPSPTPIAQPAPAPAPAESPARDGATEAAQPVPVGKGFDFYVLSLLWSPSYCAAEGEDASEQQCSRAYGFAVHGLWPQFERGWPQDCATSEPDVSRETMRTLYDIMPASGLIRYQWRKHGSCTQLAQADYFRAVRAAWDRVTIPAQFLNLDVSVSVAPDKVERAFLSANPGLKANGAAVICDEQYFREIRLCMTRELEFRSCPEVDRRDCRLKSAEMPPVRGG